MAATEKEFVAHITLAPRVPRSGGKPLKKKKRNSASTRVAAALRMAALSLRHSRTALGAYYRKLAQRLDQKLNSDGDKLLRAPRFSKSAEWGFGRR